MGFNTDILSATTISGGTFYGDGSGLTGISGGGGSFTGGTVSGSTIFTGGLTASSYSTNAFVVTGSGSTEPLFSVQGSNGQLFSISDDLTGNLFNVSTALGDPILQVYDDSTILMGNYLVPLLNTTIKTTVDTTLKNIYTIPVSAYTGAFFDYTVNNGSNLRAGSIKSVWDGSNIVWDEVKTNDLGNTTGLIFNMSISGGTAILQSSGNTSGWVVKTSARSL